MASKSYEFKKIHRESLVRRRRRPARRAAARRAIETLRPASGGEHGDRGESGAAAAATCARNGLHYGLFFMFWGPTGNR